MHPADWAWAFDCIKPESFMSGHQASMSINLQPVRVLVLAPSLPGREGRVQQHLSGFPHSCTSTAPPRDVELRIAPVCSSASTSAVTLTIR